MKYTGFLICLLAACLAGCTGSVTPTGPPNIIIIMADDMGFSDIGSYGSEIETPTLDRLAADGLRFSQFYNTARCCPTRASLLTGLYAHQAGIGSMVGQRERLGYEGYLTNRSVTIGEVLRPAGYHTGVVGKWHVSPFDYPTNTPSMPETWPLQRGFDYFYGTIAGGGNYYAPAGLMYGNEQVEPEDDYYYTDAVSDSATAFIQRNAGEASPFFLYVAYTAPHWPLHAKEADIAKYRGRYTEGWDALRSERLQRMVEMGMIDSDWPLSPRDNRAETWEDTENKEWQAERMAVYAAQIDCIDQGIGRIVQTLEKRDALDNTLILFLADNGGCAETLQLEPWGTTTTLVQQAARLNQPFTIGNRPEVMPGPWNTFQSYGPAWANASNTPFRLFKKWNHEGGIATPLIAHWPKGIAQHGAITDETGHLIDLMATCVDLAGASYPANNNGHIVLPLEGKSLAPVFETGSRKGHEYLYWEHGGNRAVRGGDWKLVVEKGKDWELYNMVDDRSEVHNLAGTMPDKAKELADAWHAWAQRCWVTGTK